MHRAHESEAAALRRGLVEQLRARGLRSEAVADAFAAVPREAFLREVASRDGLVAVYRDEAIAVKADRFGRWLSSSSQPLIMAAMLEQLDPEPGQRVLEIGAGSGYNAALLRHLVGADGEVSSIEIDAELADRAGDALATAGYDARVLTGDGHAGYQEAAPFDRIIVTASTDAIPNAWLDQLRPGGRIVLPLRFGVDVLPQTIAAYTRHGVSLRSTAMTWGGFMPLHGGEGGDGGPNGPPEDAVSASVSVRGRHALLTQASGPGLARLSVHARRRLLASLLGEPLAREHGGAVAVHWPAPPDLLLFLALRVPKARLIVIHEPRLRGVGVVARDGGGATIAVFPVDSLERGQTPSEAMLRSRRRRWRLERYGDAGEVPELTELLDEWRELVRARRTRFEITARRSRGRDAKLEFGWTAVASG
ncbi:protein-L-isoaspartate O-methyltransferase family protein [Candidatus Solirubrobacter pratensis]|uniref:protein-L-isoaspartate O-methyltransferase family protein n=1 Tax=Candidatus Solirubrobacter pratensis TaxID=1298857 RepID=UPI0003FA599C|nr:methyltransferase domain-containing protein [Candidatus Solirubrobacter pratensis]